MLPNSKRVAIIGVGLMGGSLGLALRGAGFAGQIVGYNRQPSEAATALRMGAVDLCADSPEDAVRDADLVIFATPPGSIPALMRQVAPACLPGAIVSDVGSTKQNLVAAGEAGFGARFVGAHPIAGKERHGVAAAEATLFVGSRCVLTPTATTNTEALNRIKQLWQCVGCEVLEMTPVAHDQALALTSHLPHLLAYALLAQLADHVDLGRLSGGGFRDFTRIGGSDPMLWADICLDNRDALLAAITGFEQQLQTLKQALSDRRAADLQQQLTRARDARIAILVKQAQINE